MADTLIHRGPDDGAGWVDTEAGIALGQRRLSILDLSPSGRQPMHSTCGRYVIVFNGEIYNYRDIRHELEQETGGIIWRGHSDTEVMLAAISHWGIERALQRFNGMFAFALWDRQDRILYLARDRLGEKPLYYGWMESVFLFASELKALRVHPAWQGIVNRDALTLLLRYNYIPAPYSIYRNIHKLPPATLLSISWDRPGDVEPRSYWSARLTAEQGIAQPFEGDAEQAVVELDTRLRRAVALRMEADVPLGAFLSGGVDSSTVVALMQTQSMQPVRTFTIGFREEDYNEAEHAKAVARHLGTAHTELYVTSAEAQAVIPRLPALYDEPFADSSQIPTYLVSQLARQHVTVALSGDGGDELFGGYNRYFWGDDLWRRTGWLPERLRALLARSLTVFSPTSWDRVFNALKPLLPLRWRPPTPGLKLHKLALTLATHSPELFYLDLVSHCRTPTREVLGGNEPMTVPTDRRQWAKLPEFIQRMMYLDLVSYLPDDILVKVDRASMGVSLEARVPLLDHELAEFAWRLPLSLKVRKGKGKWLLRQVLYRYVPRKLIERPKQGFGVPLASWLRGPLRDWTEALLDERRLQHEGFFNPQSIRTKWNEHLTGARSWQGFLWNVLVFQAWLTAYGEK